MSSKTAVKHYKYKNIAAAMAILLIGILALSTSCNSNSNGGEKTKPAASVSSAAKDDGSSVKTNPLRLFRLRNLPEIINT